MAWLRVACSRSPPGTFMDMTDGREPPGCGTASMPTLEPDALAARARFVSPPLLSSRPVMALDSAPPPAAEPTPVPAATGHSAPRNAGRSCCDAEATTDGGDSADRRWLIMTRPRRRSSARRLRMAMMGARASGGTMEPNCT